MQDATRQKDSYIGQPLPMLWHKDSHRVTVYFPQYTKTSHGLQNSNNILPRAMGIMYRAWDVDQYSQAQPDRIRWQEDRNEDQEMAARG